ncbi:MAG: stage II sporulation protein M [Patescibacteria group bacterium]|jgi:stage II sporulation protein M
MKNKISFIDNLAEFFKETKYTLFFVTAFFLLGILAGPIVPVSVKVGLLESLTDKFLGILTGADSWWLLATRIFINNLVVTLTLFITAIIFFLPLLIIFFNGLIIGVFLELAYYTDSYQPGNFITTIAALIPHGIFEIPGFIIGAVIGINLFLKLFLGKRIFSTRTRKESLLFYLRQFFALCLPLLLIAALVEATVSSYVMDSFTAKYEDKYLDKKLAVEIDETFLRKNNCHEIPGQSSGQSGYMDASQYLGEKIYDKELIKTLRKSSHIDHWVSNYQCAGYSFAITTANTGKYSAASSRADQTLSLQKLDYKTEELPNGILLASGNDKEYSFVFLEKNQRTISIMLDGRDDNFLLTLSSSLL